MNDICSPSCFLLNSSWFSTISFNKKLNRSNGILKMIQVWVHRYHFLISITVKYFLPRIINKICIKRHPFILSSKIITLILPNKKKYIKLAIFSNFKIKGNNLPRICLQFKTSLITRSCCVMNAPNLNIFINIMQKNTYINFPE